MARRRPAAGRQGRSERLAHRAHVEPVSNVAGLYRLALNATRQFDVRNLVVTGTDVTIEMVAGTAFVAEIPDGPTAIVLLGRGRMRFAPPDQAERTQIRLFTGADDLRLGIRRRVPAVRPSDFESRFRAESLVAAAVVADRSAARHRSLRRIPLAHAPDRSHRPEPRSLVARPFVGRPDCRGAHAPVRQPHLRALRQRGRGHHGLRSPAPAQHLHLRLGRKAGDARPLLQRRRPRRLRRPRLRGRYRRSRPTATGSTARRTCASGCAPGR